MAVKTIVVFGASGQTGKYVVSEATHRGINVRTFDKRNPSLQDLQQSIRDTDGVVIVFGPRPPYTDIFCAKTTRNIIHAMQKERVKRLICQTGAMIGDYQCNRSFIFQQMSEQFKKSNPDGYTDRTQQELYIKQSTLDWTIIKPPRLTNSTKSKTTLSGTNIKIGLLSQISRTCLSQFIVQELLTPKHIHQTLFVKN